MCLPGLPKSATAQIGYWPECRKWFLIMNRIAEKLFIGVQNNLLWKEKKHFIRMLYNQTVY